MTLPNDVARCGGVGEGEGFRAGCEDCLRRTDRSMTDMAPWWIVPPPMIDGRCVSLIEPPKHEAQEALDEMMDRKNWPDFVKG